LRGQATIRADNREYFLDIPQPGRHNLENACAALAVVRQLGVNLGDAIVALQHFPGIARRYQVLGATEDNIRVIDDYAHNADKIRAVVETAQLSCERLLCVFQPHGFGPARFLRPELKALLPTLLRPQDLFCYAPIHYAGGTVAKDISSADLANDLQSTAQVFAAGSREDLLEWLCQRAMPNDTVLLMGARDPSLPRLAQAIFDIL
jgi:UDP-N-acetylmuramate--alanine ligase